MPSLSTWRLRSETANTLTALTLALAAALFTLWQSAHVAVLWDLAYLLDSSYRFTLALQHAGPLPYRDLPFAHPPLTFLLQAVLIRLFGRVYWHAIAWAALANAAATLLTWRISLRILPQRRGLATLLATTLIPLGLYSLYPHPIYDSDCILAILAALYLLLRSADSLPSAHRWPGQIPALLAGAACVLPLFFKQNIGLLFLATTLASVTAILLARRLRREPIAAQLAVLTGAALALAAAGLTLHLTVGLASYRYWTLTFAAQRRLPGLSTLLGVYHQPSLLWTVPTSLAAVFMLSRAKRMSSRPNREARSGETPVLALWLAAALLLAPFAYAALTFFLADDPSDRADALLSLWPHLLLLAALFALDQLRRRPTLLTLLPVILLATIHGTFLSQQLWGSTYALWPLLLLLLALAFRELPAIATPLGLAATATFLLCGTPYALSLERLSYNHLSGPLAHATLPALRGMATPGHYLPNFEQLVRTTNTLIPAADGILLLPGQEPFYFATGRTPQMPILLLDPATNPYSPLQLRDQARRHNIQWLILNTDLQLTADPIPNLPDYVNALLPDFALVRTLPGYTLYRRR